MIGAVQRADAARNVATIGRETMIRALDLGSVRIGLVDAEALPLRPSDARTVQVDERDLGRAVDACLERLEGVNRVVVEHSTFYAPAGANPAKIAAMAHAHEVCTRILERLMLRLVAEGFEDRSEANPTPARVVDVIPRASWAHRVCPGTRGGVTTAMANAGLATHLAEGVTLQGQDQRDAAGCLVWAILPAPRRVGRYRYRDRRKRPKLTTAQRIERRRASWRNAKRKKRGTAERLTSGVCNCGPGGQPKIRGGRHKWTCPIAKVNGLNSDGVNRANKALDNLFSR